MKAIHRTVYLERSAVFVRYASRYLSMTDLVEYYCLATARGRAMAEKWDD